GTRAPPEVERRRAPEPAAGDARPMPRYDELGRMPRGVNAALYEGVLDDLRARAANAGLAQGSRDALLASRAGRRAYDGAPPTIPHRVDQMAVPECVACHARGVEVAGKLAPAISHDVYASCTQCHVVDRDPRGLGGGPPPANGFAGTASPGAGRRAWPGAPPQIPHAVHMRTRCESCHGPAGPNPIRSSHPERQSCQQCHVGQAANEQRARATIVEGFQP
ncbi:MAG: multiheme c-type cytochrome, partial [Myxococcales bacterium]